MPSQAPGERGVSHRHGRFLPLRRRVGADQVIASLAAESWGVVTTAELLGAGVTSREIQGRVGRGSLHRLHRGTYAVGHPSPAWQGRLLAAAKACGPRALSSEFSAAALWEFLDYDEMRYPDVTIPGAGGERHPGIRVHRTSALDPRDISRVQGVPVTSPARTLLDLAVRMDGPPLTSLVRRAQGLNRVNVAQLSEVLTRLRPRRGSRRLALVIATGPAPTKTVLEDVVLDLLLEGGFAHPVVNGPLWIAGRRVIPDFRWPRQRLVVEADGAAWHDNPVARAEDAERQALLEAAGERVLRVTWRQAVSARSQTLGRVARAGAPIAGEGEVSNPGGS